jgi:ribosomal protein S2
MKIKKIIKYKNKLLKLKLIQTKIYNKKQYLNNIKLEDIEYRLKKIFYIIYKYHIFNKRILFVGAPLNITSQIKDTKHVLIPKSVWMRGAISNKKSCFKHLSKNKKMFSNKNSELLFQLQKSMDLIVIFNESDNKDVLNEGYKSRIPIILLNSNLDIQDNKPSYKVPGNFQFTNKKTRNNFFYSILISTLKKGNIYKRSLKQISKLNPSKIKKATHNFKSNSYTKKKF